MARAILTAARVRALFDYDPEVGVFSRKRTQGRIKAGVPAGTVMATGHISIGVDGFYYLAHRLAYLYVTGSWPENIIDHINGNASDNRWVNLRSVTQDVNAQNLHRAKRTSKSGLLGVITRKENYPAKYRAWISLKGVRTRLGSFATPEEAHAAYLDAKRKLHEGCTI